jgi:hypothetical protein
MLLRLWNTKVGVPDQSYYLHLAMQVKSHQCTASSGGTLCMEYVPSLLVLEEHLQFANHEWKIKNGKILIFVY